ncbi:Gfo/Idh/MocA family oxidoreductase [Paenibacillus hodogayensis]|uniref:Gfo/Idh/MocA family oxidoreductase n=1 Tax=Paenibacillus hodogayensis TaxID=279208 RepID=A0ABV5W236_9BACL
MKKTKYVLVGAGDRGREMFAKPLADEWREAADFVGICDPNPVRAQFVSKECGGVPCYEDFDRMLGETEPDFVIVTTPDSLHHDYIIKAMEAGCNVISEKPMTTDVEKCRAILDAERRTGKKVIVTFNCRFDPYIVRIKQLLAEGTIGDILSVQMQWSLDTRHGADYFRRWHSSMAMSGGLLVHKSTHHFDMVNWWLDDEPEHVYADGGRYFYGPVREQRGERCLTCSYTDSCEFYMDIMKDRFKREFYVSGEPFDGYVRDKCVFSEEIDIYDTMSLSVKYGRGALLSYSLNAYSPYEGWKVTLVGTQGSLEAQATSDPLIDAGSHRFIHVFNQRKEHMTVKMKKVTGAHGGSDGLLRKMLFEQGGADPLRQMAGSWEGAMSLLIGASANLSIAERRRVDVKDQLI